MLKAVPEATFPEALVCDSVSKQSCSCTMPGSNEIDATRVSTNSSSRLDALRRGPCTFQQTASSCLRVLQQLVCTGFASVIDPQQRASEGERDRDKERERERGAKGDG